VDGVLADVRAAAAARGDRRPGHDRCMTRYAVPVLGVVLALVGAVWTLQGLNLLGGSFMTGSTLWLVIGLVALVGGIALVVRSLRTRRP